jgi:hypothetical protein
MAEISSWKREKRTLSRFRCCRQYPMKSIIRQWRSPKLARFFPSLTNLVHLSGVSALPKGEAMRVISCGSQHLRLSHNLYRFAYAQSDSGTKGGTYTVGPNGSPHPDFEADQLTPPTAERRTIRNHVVRCHVGHCKPIRGVSGQTISTNYWMTGRGCYSRSVFLDVNLVPPDQQRQPKP